MLRADIAQRYAEEILVAKESSRAKVQEEYVEPLRKTRSMRDDVEEATTEVATLKHQLKMVQSELLVYKADLKASDQAFKDKERALQEKERALKEIERAHDTAATQVVKLKIELADMTTKSIVTDAQLNEVLTELQRLQNSSNQSQPEALKQLVVDLDKYKEAEASLKAELEKLQAHHTLQLTAAEKASAAILADVNRKLAAKDQELAMAIKTYEDRLKEANQAIAAHKTAAETLESKALNEDAGKLQLFADLDKYKKAEASLKADLEKLQARHDADLDEIKSLNLRVKLAQDEILHLKAELVNQQSERQEKIHGLELEMQKMQKGHVKNLQLSEALNEVLISEKQDEMLRSKLAMDQVMDWHDEWHTVVESIEMDLNALSLQLHGHAHAQKQASSSSLQERFDTFLGQRPGKLPPREHVHSQLSLTVLQNDADFEPVGNRELRAESLASTASELSDKRVSWGSESTKSVPSTEISTLPSHRRFTFM